MAVQSAVVGLAPLPAGHVPVPQRQLPWLAVTHHGTEIGQGCSWKRCTIVLAAGAAASTLARVHFRSQVRRRETTATARFLWAHSRARRRCCGTSAVLRRAVATHSVRFTVADVRRALPPELFQRDESRFFHVVMIDYLRILAIGFVASTLLPACDYNTWAVSLYAIIQGTLLVGPWELGHQCNHGAFSKHRWANDTLGAWLHSTLLMPYWAWQHSHAHHHKWPNHVHQGEGACPKVQGVCSRGTVFDHFERALLSIGPEAWSVAHLFMLLILGWWGYILFGVSGAPAWGKAGSSIFFAPNGMFPDERPQLLAKQRVSVGFVCCWLAVLGAVAFATSPTFVMALYFAPYLVCNMWLIVIVLLQHTKDDLPHFGNGEYNEDASPWTLEKGVLCGTVDRPAYGWIGRELHHNAGTFHVIHHLFPQIPFYNTCAASEAFDKFLLQRGCSGLRRVDETPIPQALWELGLLRREVRYVPETGDYRYLVAGHEN